MFATWFKKLTGISEKSSEYVRERLVVESETITSKANGACFNCGRLETPSLAELRTKVGTLQIEPKPITVREVVADVQPLHVDPKNAGALFQVASQFNLLEMVSPDRTPEDGIGIYERDPTQGPACAIAAGAGTIYRNYFAEVNGRTGQTADNQIDCLKDLGDELGNGNGQLWTMQNGYALPTAEGLTTISDRLRTGSTEEREQLKQSLRIGVQWNTQVTLNECDHLVTQAYCSALPVAYSRLSDDLWKEFAILVLEAAYEATICAATINAQATGNRTVFLTLLGGGAFGNHSGWIVNALGEAIDRYHDSGLDLVIVSYGSPQRCVQPLLT